MWGFFLILLLIEIEFEILENAFFKKFLPIYYTQGFNSDTVWVDSLWKLSQILYESVTDSLTNGHGFFIVLVCPLEEEWKW